MTKKKTVAELKQEKVAKQRRGFMDEVRKALIKMYEEKGCDGQFSMVSMYPLLKKKFGRFGIKEKHRYDAILQALNFIVRHRQTIMELEDGKHIFVHLYATAGSPVSFCFVAGVLDPMDEFQKLQKK